MGKVSLVGAGMSSHPGVAAKTFTVLGDAGVNIEMISTSPIKISCVVREEHVETAVRELHAAFELGEDAVQPRGRVRRPPAGGHMRVAVVGATGAVGSTILGVMRERAFAADEVVPFASERSAGRDDRLGRRRRSSTPRAVRRVDPGLRPGALLGRLGRERGVGAALRRGRRRRGRQLVVLAHEGRRAAGGGRGQPRGARRPRRASWPTPTARPCRWWWRSSRSSTPSGSSGW